MVSVSGKLQSSANGTAVVGSIEVMLCGYGSWIPRVQGIALVAGIQGTVAVASDGGFTFTVAPNDTIEPDGTYYTVTVKDDNGDVAQINAYRFLSSPASYDLNSLDPYDPNQPPPPFPPLGVLQIVPPSDAMVFDGSVYSTFKTTLPGDVNHPVFQNMRPGNLYTFIIQMNAFGNWAFLWPSNVHNTTIPNQNNNGGTIQTFVADENGDLWPIGPATFY